MTLARALRGFNPDEPRDEHGRWTSGGGSEDAGTGITFVSPNVSNLTFDQAAAKLNSEEQRRLATAGNYIDSKLGISDSTNRNALGAWSDGAENSLMVIAHGASRDQMRAAAAMKGYIADQKAVLVFTPNAGGSHRLLTFDVKDENIAAVHNNLLQDGLAFHTLEDLGGGNFRVHAVASDDSTREAAERAAERYDATGTSITGNGEFIGTTLESGTDREQRDDARRIYQQTIEGISLPGHDVGGVWDDVRDYWSALAADAKGLSRAAHDVSDEPRDEHGRWTDGGGADGGDKPKREHPGEGYSAGAWVDDKGVIHTSNVYDAQRALFEDRKVELSQIKQVSTLIKRLGETAAEMAEQGEAAPVFNLCNVTVKGTNLFCAESKGIPRVEMPVIPAKRTKDFVKYLKKQGYKIEKDDERAANLRATQSEISGAKVAIQMARIKEEGFYKRLVISRDDYILDGHHTWAGQLGLDAQDNDLHDEKSVKVARVDISIIKLIEEADKWTKAEGISKKPASEAPKGYRYLTLVEAREQLDPNTYRKYHDVVQRFFAANIHLAVNLDRLLITVETTPRAFDPALHPHVPAGSPEGGQFAPTGGGAGGGEAKPEEPKPDESKLDPKVIEVGGDEWNRATARRLEREYQQARPKLDKLAVESVDNSEVVHAQSLGVDEDEDEEEEESTYIPESWDEMSGDQQSTAEDKYYEQNLSDYIQSEQDSFYENDGQDMAKMKVVEDYNDDSENEWAADAIEAVMTEFAEEGNRIPYSSAQLLSAIKLEGYELGDWYHKDVEVEFDDDQLQDPIDKPAPHDPSQLELELPGTPPPKEVDYSAHLTDDMRSRLTKAIETAFDKAADKVTVDPPDYLEESAKDFMKEMWDQMEDKQKFSFTKNNTDILDEEVESHVEKPSKAEVEIVTGLPEKYDPLNDTSGTDYRRTQALARYLSVARAVEVLKERDIKGEFGDKFESPQVSDISVLDRELWEAWKASSTTKNGKVLQVAIADELGGRLNKKTAEEIDREKMIAYANTEFANVGGYDGIKAYVRAKWETTQYLLDKAGVAELQLYRGYTEEDDEKFQKDFLKHYSAMQEVGKFKHLPTLDMLRNGAASTTTDRDVANSWKKNSPNKIVLRASVPRTAAISVPAYGINVHSEHEVVVAGTAWKGWDAWAKYAPAFDEHPLKIAA